MRVVSMRAGECARVKDIEGGLLSMQQEVGGYIELCYMPILDKHELCIVCNDEGKMLQKAPNRFLVNDEGTVFDVIAGDAFICKAPAMSDELTSVDEEDCRWLCELMDILAV